jgi:hypothetical protein
MLHCELITTKLAEAKYEALSYVWGVTIRPYMIQVNGCPFQVTYNLYSALRELRLPDTERLLWIDAMCINQSDNIEEGSQVQLMQAIYTRASRVIVWLGDSTSGTAYVFDLAQGIDAADMDIEKENLLWSEKTASRRWRTDRREVHHILDHDWWTRVWIIQEVVSGSDVTMRRGGHEIAWDAFRRLLACNRFRKTFWYRQQLQTICFAQNIQDLRQKRESPEASSEILLGLALRFHNQSATFGSDKLYGLMGLLESDNPTAIVPDYTKRPEDVFVNFSMSCIANSKTLDVIALASVVSLQDVTWCCDWEARHAGFHSVLSIDPPNSEGQEQFSASGTHQPIHVFDSLRCILSLKG